MGWWGWNTLCPLLLARDQGACTVWRCALPILAPFEREAAGAWIPEKLGKLCRHLRVGGSGHRGLSICHAAVPSVKTVQVCGPSPLIFRAIARLADMFIPRPPGWWGWFILKKTQAPFQVGLSFRPSLVCANISRLIEHSSLFQPRHMLAFPAQYGHLGVWSAEHAFVSEAPLLRKDQSQVTTGRCAGEMRLHFWLASSLSGPAKLIFHKSRFGHLQAHLEHAAAYLLLIPLITAVGLETSLVRHVARKDEERKELWADFS